MSSASIAVELTATEGASVVKRGTGPATFATSSAEAALSGVLRGIELLGGERVGRAASLGREVPRALRRLSIVRKMTDAAPAPASAPAAAPVFTIPKDSPFGAPTGGAPSAAPATAATAPFSFEFKLGNVTTDLDKCLVAPIAPTGEVPKEEPAAATAANARKMRRKDAADEDEGEEDADPEAADESVIEAARLEAAAPAGGFTFDASAFKVPSLKESSTKD